MKVALLWWPYTSQFIGSISQAVTNRMIVQSVNAVRSDVSWLFFVPHHDGPIKVSPEFFDGLERVELREFVGYGPEAPHEFRHDGFSEVDFPAYYPDMMKWLCGPEARGVDVVLSWFCTAQTDYQLQTMHNAFPEGAYSVPHVPPSLINFIGDSGNAKHPKLNTVAGCLAMVASALAADSTVLLSKADKQWLMDAAHRFLSAMRFVGMVNSLRVVDIVAPSENVPKYERPEGRVNFGYAGSLEGRHNWKFLIETMAKIKVRVPKVKFVMITQVDAPQHPYVQYAKSQLGESAMIFTGCDRPAYEGLLESIDFLLVDVDYSGTALTITEAIHSGCVPIVMKRPWTSPRFDEYKTFTATNPREFEAMALYCAKNPKAAHRKAAYFMTAFRESASLKSIGSYWSSLLDDMFKYRVTQYRPLKHLLFDLAQEVADGLKKGKVLTFSDLSEKMQSIAKSPKGIKSLLKSNGPAFRSGIICKKIFKEDGNGNFIKP